MTIKEIVEKIYKDWYNNQDVDFVMSGVAIKGKITKVGWADNAVENRLKITLESGAVYNIDRKGFKGLLKYRKNCSGLVLSAFKGKKASRVCKTKKKLVEPACAFVASLF